ncbi:MAG: Gfo/Idh/MocA family oxidoreductase [Bacteroidales bacterium]|nr:Gfo/Idh/MocA family oxidoreductase [Bacteroidales bacterium]
MMKKIGVFGVGHLGQIHCKCINESPLAELIGIYDVNIEHAREVAESLKVPYFDNPEDLLECCDIADIVCTTTHHYEMAKLAMNHQKPCFIEKPVTATIPQAEELLELQQKYQIPVQVGHVERFNPAFLAARPKIGKPMFIEVHRLALFNPRGNDVSVILDLMIHDIDIVLKLVNSPIVDIQASGVAIVTDTFDIANVRLTFENGCVANLTASRLSMKNMRKIRLFQNNAYISMDLLEKKTEMIHIENVDDSLDDPFAMILDLGEKGKRRIMIDNPESVPNNAIRCELESFIQAIEQQQIPEVSLKDGFNALKTAYEIMDKMNNNIK